MWKPKLHVTPRQAEGPHQAQHPQHADTMTMDLYLSQPARLIIGVDPTWAQHTVRPTY